MCRLVLIMKCENCKKEHDGSYGSGRFCSSKCTKSFSTKNKREEINKKVSESLKKEKTSKSCKECSKIFYSNRREQLYCSPRCARLAVRSRKEYKDKMRRTQLRKVENGTHKGWQSRNIKSYAEKFFIEVLKNNNLFDKCVLEHAVKKRDLGIECDANYFLDFYFPDKNIDLEIDGKQHEYEDRLESDKKRDKVLKDNGYKVYRIKWKNPISDENKAYIKSEINKFLGFYDGQ